jgi:uncharacterized protein
MNSANKKILNILLFTFLLLCLSWGKTISIAHALDIPNLRGYVNDYADMISPSVKAELENELRAFEQTDSTQIVILTVPSLEGEVIEDFSIKAAEAWKIGQKGKDNGVILTVAKQERKLRIEVGRGLEGKLTDLMAGRIIDLVIKPKFKRGDLNEGFIAGVHALIDATRGEFKIDEKRRPPKGDIFSILFHVIPFLIFAAIIALRSRIRRGVLWPGGGYGGIGSGFGGGGFSGGGGFGGGGGGDFGGGGASGDW